MAGCTGCMFANTITFSHIFNKMLMFFRLLLFFVVQHFSLTLWSWHRSIKLKLLRVVVTVQSNIHFLLFFLPQPFLFISLLNVRISFTGNALPFNVAQIKPTPPTAEADVLSRSLPVVQEAAPLHQSLFLWLFCWLCQPLLIFLNLLHNLEKKR